MRDLAEARYLSAELLEQASRRLEELGKLVNRKELAAALLVDDPMSQRVRTDHAWRMVTETAIEKLE